MSRSVCRSVGASVPTTTTTRSQLQRSVLHDSGRRVSAMLLSLLRRERYALPPPAVLGRRVSAMLFALLWCERYALPPPAPPPW